MNLKVIFRAFMALAGLNAVRIAEAADVVTWVVANEEQLLAAGAMVGNPVGASPHHVMIQVRPGTYLLKDSFRIARSGVTLMAEKGAKFVLASNVNEPVLAIGSQQEAPSATQVIHDVAIMGLEIDGNRLRQNSEFSAKHPWIRNNGIDVRAVHGLRVTNVTANHNRSGGLVISWGCSDVRVFDSTFENNHFDGVAFYASKDVEVVGCTMARNQAAGISLDNEFVDSRFTRCVLAGNGDVGVFARSTERVEFNDCIVRQSGSWAYFLAHDKAGRGVIDVVISGGEISGNRGGLCMASVNEQQSRGTRVVGALFTANDGHGRRDIFSSGSVIHSTIGNGPDGGANHPTLNLATIR